jgi:hypothetical protein
MWPKSTGKGPREYIEGASSRLDRGAFELDLRRFVGQQRASKLDATHVRVLFDISDEHLRRVDAVYSMKRDALVRDWKRRRKLIATTNAKLATLRESLKKSAENQGWPVTALYAKAVNDRLVLLQKDLDHEIAQIKQHQRLSKIMLEALHLKTLRSDFVAEVHNYIANEAFPDSAKEEQNALIAGTMCAAREYTSIEQADDVLERMPMAVFRARQHIDKEIRAYGEFPIFRTRPRKDTDL